MNPERTTVPLTVITGIDAAAKARVAQVLLARSGEGWGLLDNDGGGAAAAAGILHRPAAVSSGCACCTGQVMLHASMVQLLRQHRPRQLLLVAAAAAEPEALRRALAQGVAMRAWQLLRTLCVWDETTAATAGDQARALWQNQRDAADALVLCGPATSTAEVESQIEAVAATPASASRASSRRIVS